MKKTGIHRLLAVLVFALLSFSFHCNLDSVTNPQNIQPDPDACKILFIGSSYFNYNNLPSLFGVLASSANKKVAIGQHIINGTFLDYHAGSLATEEWINAYDWDFVILQGVCTNAAFPDSHHVIFPPYERHPLKQSILTLMSKIRANCDSTQTVYCMPWAFEDGTTWIEGRDETYFDMQQLIYENTLKLTDELGFILAPVGWAWKTVLEAEPGLH